MTVDSPAVNGEFLIFKLGTAELGVDILMVQEIRVWSGVTAIPNTPDYLKGVINLRGVIVPIVDLGQRFHNTVRDFDTSTVVIVLHGVVNGKSSMIGLVVDSVSNVHSVTAENIKVAPDLGSKIDNQFVSGMATIEDRIVVLLDSAKLLDVEELFQRANELTRKAS